MISLVSVSFSGPASTSNFAAVYVPADGFRLRLVAPGNARSIEWARGTASDLIAAGPIASLNWLVKQKGDPSSALTRLTSTFSDGTGVVHRSDDFLIDDADGLRTAVETQDNDSYRIYTPARLDLPNAVAAGRHWVSDGQAAISLRGSKEQVGAYHAEFSASAPQSHDEVVRRCLHITMTQNVNGVAEPAITRTWCPGLGITAVSDAQGAATASTDPLRVPPAAATSFAWKDAASLTLSQHAVESTGANGMILLPQIPAALLADDTLVSVQVPAGHMMGLGVGGQEVGIRWRARPGARTTAVAGFGDRVVAANTERQLVAYDVQGQWLWQAPLPDLVVTTPVRLGDAVVVAGLDGSVSAYALVDGQKLWSNRLTAEVRLPPKVVGDRVVVVDQTGAVACFDTSGVEQWSQQLDPSSRFTVTSGANPVVVVKSRTSIWVTAFALRDGSQAWRAEARLSGSQLLGLDGQAVLVDRTQLLSLDADTGTVRWARSGDTVYDAAGGVDHLMLLGLDRVTLLDGGGRPVQSWATPVGATENSAGSIVVGASQLAVIGPHGVFLGAIR
ncbi:MAG: PQQ-like beta-propeller repeat protein [Propionibacteriales bacterium]|nr:PQQ-like beta-propeller repeat protein [Propionibacteriales bacterium]